MRTKALIGLLLVAVLLFGVAQQAKPPAQQEQNKPNNQQSQNTQQKQNQAKPQQPKVGTLTAQAKPLQFLSRGEGTLTIRGKGFILVGDLQGNITTDGFKEQKELPRGVKLQPPWDKRLRIFMGQGTFTVQGKYDTVRVSLREGSLDFRGGASFNLGGNGTALLDGQKKVTLFASATVTLYVPEPEWMKQPPEPDVKPVPYKKEN